MVAARGALIDLTRQVTLAEVEAHVVRYTGSLGHPLAVVLRFLRGGPLYVPTLEQQVSRERCHGCQRDFSGVDDEPLWPCSPASSIDTSSL